MGSMAVEVAMSQVIKELKEIVPDGRHKSLMMTKLEEAWLWADKAIDSKDKEEKLWR